MEKLGRALSLLFAALVAFTSVPPALAQEPMAESALLQIQALQQEKLARTPAQTKMDSQFIYALKRGTFKRLAPEMEPNLETTSDGLVLVDITGVVSEALLGRIQELGGRIVGSFPNYRSIRALIPLSAIEPLAERTEVSFIERAAEMTTNTGSVTGEGDTTHRAAATRTPTGACTSTSNPPSTAPGTPAGLAAPSWSRTTGARARSLRSWPRRPPRRRSVPPMVWLRPNTS